MSDDIEQQPAHTCAFGTDHAPLLPPAGCSYCSGSEHGEHDAHCYLLHVEQAKTTYTDGHGVAGEPRTVPLMAHETPGRVGADTDVEQVWNDFWGPTIDSALEWFGQELDHPGSWLVRADNGTFLIQEQALTQIKRELFDFHTVIQTVPAVYSHATGGAMSKATYNDVSQITGCIDEHYEDVYKDLIWDAIKGAREEVQAVTGSTADVLLDEFVESLRAYFNIDPKDLA